MPTTTPVTAHALPGLMDPALLPGSVAVVIDLLRASTTITAALDAGATAVVPCLEPDDARRLRDAPPHAHAPCLLGGERGGVRIDGFDIGNSPAEYTPGAVRGRTLLFSTTNGTRAVLSSHAAARILVGCLANRAALCSLLAADGRPVRLVCAGTNGAITADDCLCAGAIIEGLLAAAPGRFSIEEDDQAQLFLGAYRSVREPTALLAALRASRGGRNLARIGLDSDVVSAARADTTGTVPELDPRSQSFRPAPPTPLTSPTPPSPAP